MLFAKSASRTCLRDCQTQDAQDQLVDQVTHPATLMKMAAAKIDAKGAPSSPRNWKWAEPVTQENRHAEHSWQTVKGGKGASATAKATAGCRVGIDSEGRFAIFYGLIRPGDVKKTAKAAGSAKAKSAPKGPVKISNSLDERLEHSLMRATQDALKGCADGKDLGHTLAGVVAAQLHPDRGLYHTPEAIRHAL